MNLSKSLCESCTHVRRISSGKGSVFLLCREAQSNPRLMKYPPQPVRVCPAYRGASDSPS